MADGMPETIPPGPAASGEPAAAATAPAAAAATAPAATAAATAWSVTSGAARTTGRNIPVRAIHHLHQGPDDDAASATAAQTAQNAVAIAPSGGTGGTGGLANMPSANATSAGSVIGIGNGAGNGGCGDHAMGGGNGVAGGGGGSSVQPSATAGPGGAANMGAGLQGRRSGNPSPVQGRKSPRSSPRTSPMPRTSPAHGRPVSPLYSHRTSPRASPVTANAWTGLASGVVRNKSPHHHGAGAVGHAGAAKSAFNKVKPKRGQLVAPQIAPGTGALAHYASLPQGNADLVHGGADPGGATLGGGAGPSSASSMSSSSASSSAAPSAFAGVAGGITSTGRSLSASTGTPSGRRSSSRSPIMVGSGAARARLSPSQKAFVTASTGHGAAGGGSGPGRSSRGPTSPVIMVGPPKSSHQRQDPTSRDLEFLMRGREPASDSSGGPDSAGAADDPGFGSDNELMMYSSGPLDESGRRRPSSSSATEMGGSNASALHVSGGSVNLGSSARPKSCTGSIARRMTSPTFDANQRQQHQPYQQQHQQQSSQRGFRASHAENSSSGEIAKASQYHQTHGTATGETKRLVDGQIVGQDADTQQIQQAQATSLRGRTPASQSGVHPRLRSNSLDSPLRASEGGPGNGRRQHQHQHGGVQAVQSSQNHGWTANSQLQLQQASARRQQIKLNQQRTLQMQLMEHQHNHQMQQRQLLQQEQYEPAGGSGLASAQNATGAGDQGRPGALADLDDLTLEEVFEYERRLHSRKAQLLRERVYASQPQGSTSRQGADSRGMSRVRDSSAGSVASQDFDAMLENEFLVEPATGPLGSLPHPRDRCNSGNCILDDMDDACVPGVMDFEEGEGFASDVPDGARAPNVKMFRSCDRSASGYISPGSMGSCGTPRSIDIEGDMVEELRNKISEGFSKNLSQSPGNISFVSRLAVTLDPRPTVARLKSPTSAQLETMRNPIETTSLSPDPSKVIGSLRSPRSAFSRAQKPEASAPRSIPHARRVLRTQRSSNAP